MVIATYGPRVFEVNPDKIYTFDGFSYSSALTYENQEVEGSKPSTYIKGEELDNISFTITIDSSFGVNPRYEWGYWKQMLTDKQTYPFILAGVPINDAQFLLTDISVSDTNILGNGDITKLTLEIKLQEYVRAGKKIEESSSSKKSKNQGYDEDISGVLSITDDTDEDSGVITTINSDEVVEYPSVLNADEKSELKR